MHPAFFAAGTKSDVDTGEPEHHLLEGRGRGKHLRGPFKQALDEGQGGCALAVSQKPVMTYSDKALGQSVEEKAVDKVHRGEGGLLEDIVLPIFVPEADHAIFESHEATVGDSHAVGVTGQILKDMLSMRDGVPHTDDPLVLVELIFKLKVGFFKVQVSTLSGSCEVVDELATKDQGEGFLVEQVGILAGDPAAALCAQGTSGYQAVQMEVGFELLIPGMQDSDKAQGPAQFLPPKLDQGLRDGFEEEVEHHGFVL